MVDSILIGSDHPPPPSSSLLLLLLLHFLLLQGSTLDSPHLSKLDAILEQREQSLAALERLRKEAEPGGIQQLRGREEFLRNEHLRLETKLADTM